MKATLLVTSAASSILALLALLATMPAPAQAEGEDAGAYVKSTLRWDGFEDNRCYRFADPRRRGQPYLQPHYRQAHPRPDSYETRYALERRPSVDAEEVRDQSWRERNWRDRDYDGDYG